MLIKIEFNEESGLSLEPIELVNSTDEIQTRVEHKFTYISPDQSERETAADGSLMLKFTTPWNKVATQEARTILYLLYKHFTTNKDQIKSLILYSDDIQVFNSEEMGLELGSPFLADTALDIEDERDNYIVLSMPLTWKKVDDTEEEV